MSHARINANAVQEQKNVVNTHQDEKKTGMTRIAPAPPVGNTTEAKEPDRYERVRQIQIQAVPQLTVPETTLFDDYTAAYEKKERKDGL